MTSRVISWCDSNFTFFGEYLVDHFGAPLQLRLALYHNLNLNIFSIF